MSFPPANLGDPRTIPDDLSCPLCGYSLRGLQEPRCPECGYRFTWQELIESREREHPFAFDAARKSSLWNAFRTVVASFLPRQLWATLKPSHEVRVGRVLLFLLLMWLPLLGVLRVLAVEDYREIWKAYDREVWDRSQQKAITAAELANPAELLKMQRLYGAGLTRQECAERYWGNASIWLYLGQPRMNRCFFGLLVGVPTILSILPALLIFQWSMRSRHISGLHVLRCFAYANSAISLLAMGVMALALFQYLKQLYLLPDWMFSIFGDWPLYLASTWADPTTVHKVFALAVILMGWPLWIAYRRYFRFDHALLTVLSMQIIVLLCWAILEVWIFG